MKTIFIESPFSSVDSYQADLNDRYLRACLKFCIVNDCAPFASHGLYTKEGVLDDKIPVERKMGIYAGEHWRAKADGTFFFVDLGWSQGMSEAHDKFQSWGQYRKLSKKWVSLPKDLLDEFDIPKLWTKNKFPSKPNSKRLYADWVKGSNVLALDKNKLEASKEVYSEGYDSSLPAEKYLRRIYPFNVDPKIVCKVDIYRVLNAFKTGHVEVDHAVKKLLVPGTRGSKPRDVDLAEAIWSIQQAINLLKLKAEGENES